MTYTSNNPHWWPTINFMIVSSRFIVASSIIVAYDWALKSGQEFELIWSQHWSLITVLYLVIPGVYVLSGTHQCLLSYYPEGKTPLLIGGDWDYVTGLIWEIITLSLAVWIVIKHFRELRRQELRWNVRGCFAVLIQTHLFYFAAFAVTSCFTFGGLSKNLSNVSSVGVQIYDGIGQIVTVVQLFVLGPRLILSVRAHHAQLLANSDEGTAMATIAFQERIHEFTGSDVSLGGSLAGTFRV
ncbi:hypothetical protein CY34DRAFT_15025 [Suillus luteus UH-Slu-Lm8-n1]|uniref:Unplaced genomic scaffold CY34scaffold_260, whole genome shotgun sequence n=1 Tax=Suillus luteus UH-Slu-Lm8-n1 TaxID=930992 RepID=A0A0D0A9N0_9AGAM|nr:hypothetical protein CY34DRAFT_15025 [Suillus luteus UH-Slu-Lm8-n1]